MTRHTTTSRFASRLSRTTSVSCARCCGACDGTSVAVRAARAWVKTLAVRSLVATPADLVLVRA